MIRKMDHQNSCSSTEASYSILIRLYDCDSIHSGHTARPSDFCWAPGVGEQWTAATTSEDNIVMIWQPTARIWAGDEVKIDERELEDDAMEGIEEAGPPNTATGSKQVVGSGATSARSQSMSISATASNSGADVEEDN